jgi:hypothetical protein
MNRRRNGAPRPTARYEIRVEGQLSPLWAEWFDGLALTNLPEEGQVLMRGPVHDQAALHGILTRLRDLNLVIISIRKLDGEREF